MGKLMDIADVFKFYREEFVPAYSDLVTFIGEKPEQILVEIENTLSHISQYFNPRISEMDKNKNVEKSYNHLVRATLDCYKLICVMAKREIEKFFTSIGKTNLIWNKYLSFVDTFREARKIEMENVGINPLASLEKYKEASKKGGEVLAVIRQISESKPQIFVGYRYTDEDEEIAAAFMELLELEGFKCITAKTSKAEDVNEKVKKIIARCDGAAIIFTKEKELKDGGWTTSAWLKDEKAYALGVKKPVLLFFEKDISDSEKKGIHGDLEYIEFERERLHDAILKAIPYVRDFYEKIIGVKGLVNL